MKARADTKARTEEAKAKALAEVRAKARTAAIVKAQMDAYMSK